MKFTKVIILLVTITLAFTTNMDKKRNKIKSHSGIKASSALENSMDGYYNVRIDVDGDEKSEGKFYTNNVKTPTGKYANGMYFETTKRDGDLSKIAVLDGNSIFIPYRLIGSCDYGNPFMGRRYLTFPVTTSSRTYVINLRFDWIDIGSGDQGTICSWINTNRYSSRNSVTLVKRNSIGFSSGYMDNMNSAENAARGVSGIDSQIRDNKNEMARLTNEMATIDASQKAAEVTRTSTQTRCDTLKTKDLEFTRNYDTVKATIDAKTKAKTDLTNNAANMAQVNKDRLADAKNHETDFLKAVDLLTKNCIGNDCSDYIASIRAEFYKKNLPGVNTGLNGVYTSSS